MISFKSISSFLNQKNEIEVRFNIDDESGVFYRVKDNFQLNTFVHSKDEIIDEKTRKRITYFDDGTVQAITKTSLYFSPITEYNMRLSVSKEIPIDIPVKYNVISVRDKKRWTHYEKTYQIDFTEINTIKNNHTITSWEIEIELSDNGTVNDLETATIKVLKLIQGTNIIFKNSVKHAVISSWNSNMDVIGAPTKNGVLILDHNVLSNARNLKRRDLVHEGIDTGYIISQKADGVSKCLYIDKSGIWFLSPIRETNLLIDKDTNGFESKFKPFYGSCIIGELIPENKRKININTPYYFIPFDILYIPGIKNKVQIYDIKEPNETKRYNYIRRLDIMKNLITKLNPYISSVITFGSKDFLDIGRTTESFREVFEIVKNKPLDFQTDGYILTPIFASYNPHSDKLPLYKRKLTTIPDICKIKPWEELTIDFRIISSDVSKNICLGKNGQQLSKALYVNNTDKGSVCFSGDLYFPFYQDINVDWEHPMIKNLEGGVIVEFGPVKKDGIIILEPRRLRNDKKSPNKIDIASDVWSDINSYLNESTLLSQDFEKLYQQNNAIKRELFDNNLESDHILIDFGSGKGGDLSKWKKASYIYCIEPNKTNFTELYNRINYYNMNDKVTVLECGAEDTDYILSRLNITNKKVIVSMMLSLSFFWKDKEMLDKLQYTLSSIAKVSNNPVKFLYYTIEGNRTKKLFEERGSDITLGPCHMIIKDNTIFIDIKNSIVVDQTEYLVNLEDLICIKNRSEHPSVKEQYLSEDEKTYGNLFIYGIGDISPDFQPSTPIIIIPITIINEILAKPHQIVENDNVRIDTLHDGGNIFHAFLNTVSLKYKNSNSDKKIYLVLDFRNTLLVYLRKINPKFTNKEQVINSIGFDPLTKNPFLSYNSYFNTSKYLVNKNYDDFAQLLKNTNEVHFQDIGFLSDIFDININIFNKQGLVIRYDCSVSNKYINIYTGYNNDKIFYESMAKISNNNSYITLFE